MIVSNLLSQIRKLLCEDQTAKVTWSRNDLTKLVSSGYQAQSVKNKIVILSYENSTVILDLYKNILSQIPSSLIDIIVVKHIGGGSVRQQCVEFKNDVKVRPIGELLKAKEKYKVLILPYPEFLFSCNAESGTIYGAEFIGEKLVCVGASYTSCNWGETFNVYDLIFCGSNWIKGQLNKKIGERTELVVYGNPRYRRLSLNEENALKQQLLLDENKKTIVWCPTHTEMSSFPSFIDFIAPLQDKFNIVLKAYPLLDHSKEFRLLESQIPNVKIVYEQGITSEEVINIADFVLCDYGGSAFHAIYLDKNLIFLNHDNSNVVSRFLEPDSPELEIRKDIVNFYKRESKRFIESIYNESIWNSQKLIRKKYREKYFESEEKNVTAHKEIAKHLLSLLTA